MKTFPGFRDGSRLFSHHLQKKWMLAHSLEQCVQRLFFFFNEKYSSDTAVYRIIKKSYLRGYAEEAVKVLERGKRRKAILKLNPDFTASTENIK